MSRQCRALAAIFVAAVMFFALAAVSRAQQQEGRLMRFPDIYKDTIVFSHGGDLWIVPTSGGVARRPPLDGLRPRLPRRHAWRNPRAPQHVSGPCLPPPGPGLTTVTVCAPRPTRSLLVI